MVSFAVFFAVLFSEHGERLRRYSRPRVKSMSDALRGRSFEGMTSRPADRGSWCCQSHGAHADNSVPANNNSATNNKHLLHDFSFQIVRACFRFLNSQMDCVLRTQESPEGCFPSRLSRQFTPGRLVSHGFHRQMLKPQNVLSLYLKPRYGTVAYTLSYFRLPRIA